jgi:ribonuclease HI
LDAYQKKKFTIGWGWCLHNYRGRFILFPELISCIHTKLNTLEDEAMTIKEAIEEIMQRGLTHVIFESDSKVVVGAIHSR